MYADFQDLGKISENLSLRRSPERKFAPQNNLSSQNNIYSPSQTRKKVICCPSFCCDCCCCHICCCVPYCCLNYDYDSLNNSDDLNDPNLKKNENINSSSLMGKMSTKYQTNKNPQLQNENKYFSYEQNQFNDFLKKLMEAEAQIEDAKISLSLNPDFNCEDAFRLFEENDKGYLDENDLKYGLNLIGLNPSDQDIKLLMKRFDLQKSGGINYADFFDIIVPFEKNYRLRVEDRMPNSCCPCRSLEAFSSRTINELRDLFNLIINLENEINNMRKMFGTLKLNLRDIFGNVDTSNKGFFTSEELIEYLDNNQILMNVRDADLLYIRLDKNRNGRIDYSEVEDEIQTVY